jgi:hypothetical protein
VPYPKQLFKAGDGAYQDDQLEWRIVKNETEHRTVGSQWKESPDEARAYYDAQQLEFAKAAAEVAHKAQGMSAKAQAELRAAEVASDDHVVDVTPKRRS